MQQLSGDLNYVFIWTGYPVLGTQESVASWEHLFIVLAWFVCVGFGCLLLVGVLWGFVGIFLLVWEGVFWFFCNGDEGLVF